MDDSVQELEANPFAQEKGRDYLSLLFGANVILRLGPSAE